MQVLIEESNPVSQSPNGDIAIVCAEKSYKITELGNLLYKYGLNK